MKISVVVDMSKLWRVRLLNAITVVGAIGGFILFLENQYAIGASLVVIALIASLRHVHIKKTAN